MSALIDFANTPLPFFSVMALHFQLGENACLGLSVRQRGYAALKMMLHRN